MLATLHDPRLPSRFWAKITVNGDCWIWTGATAGPTTDGRTPYGYFNVGGKSKRAHRVAYEALVGPIPEDKPHLDHVKAKGCLGTTCVNPAHLEPVTNRENCLRGNSPWARSARKTHCVRGHPFDEANTAIYNGKRSCKQCNRDKALRAYYAKRPPSPRRRKPDPAQL